MLLHLWGVAVLRVCASLVDRQFPSAKGRGLGQLDPPPLRAQGVIPESPPWWCVGGGREWWSPSLFFMEPDLVDSVWVALTMPRVQTGFKVLLCELWHWGSASQYGRYVVPAGFVCAARTSGRTAFFYCRLSRCPHRWAPGWQTGWHRQACLFPQHSRETAAFSFSFSCPDAVLHFPGHSFFSFCLSAEGGSLPSVPTRPFFFFYLLLFAATHPSFLQLSHFLPGRFSLFSSQALVFKVLCPLHFFVWESQEVWIPLLLWHVADLVVCEFLGVFLFFFFY